ncbi:unnamed protein product [Notodromas monacha]|uniref:Uncharacterized protein n=1 Tax=Notodromas monacha TaxID=399045 RepID=A0A7R9BWB4_9CRUS|nr:unnamed protein product [Notodromas monacha]CAG0921980.1 unnamed protein product [Notodromas monacha]
MHQQDESNEFSLHLLYRSLGLCLVVADPEPETRLQLVNKVWKGVGKLSSAEAYVSCAEVWIQFVLKHFSTKEVNAFIGNVVKHVALEKDRESIYPSLHSILDKILLSIVDFAALFAMDKFLPLLDLFEKESDKVEACKMIIDAYLKRVDADSEPLMDPFIIGALMNICRTMHNSLNALSVVDERRRIGNLINGFLLSVSYEKDFEAQLNFYADARAAFSILDSVMSCLVQRVNTLAMATLEIMEGVHSKKTGSFLRACVAFCFITIPSIESTLTRLDLYSLTGQVALANQCWGQAEACFQAIVDDLKLLPKCIEIDGRKASTDPWFEQFVMNFASALLLLPDASDEEPMVVLKRLLDMLDAHQWERQTDGLFRVQLGILQLLSAATQEVYIHHIEGVDSNDTLYGGQGTFLQEVEDLASGLLEDLLGKLKECEDQQAYQRQMDMGVRMLDTLTQFADLREPALVKLAVNLWNLVQRNGGAVGQKLLVRRLESLKRRSESGFTDDSGVEGLYSLIPKLQFKSTV